MSTNSSDSITGFPPIAEISSRLDKLEVGLSHLSSSGGGGGNIELEARVAKLEASVEHIQRDTTDIKIDIRDIKNDMRSDFRWLIGGGIAAAIAVLGVMAKGFNWL